MVKTRSGSSTNKTPTRSPLEEATPCVGSLSTEVRAIPSFSFHTDYSTSLNRHNKSYESQLNASPGDNPFPSLQQSVPVPSLYISTDPSHLKRPHVPKAIASTNPNIFPQQIKCESFCLANPSITWERIHHESYYELLCDYESIESSSQGYGAIIDFFKVATPIVTLPRRSAPATYTLSQLWSYYDNAYGFEIVLPVPHTPFLPHTTKLFYVPLLSAVRIQASDGFKFEHFVNAPPSDRPPLILYVDELEENYEVFRNLNQYPISNFTSQSWYSVLWVPIYCQHHTPQRSAGTFLTYHWLIPVKVTDNLPFFAKGNRRGRKSHVDTLSRINGRFMEVIFKEHPFRAQKTLLPEVRNPQSEEELQKLHSTGYVMNKKMETSVPTFSKTFTPYEVYAKEESECSKFMHPLFAFIPYRAKAKIWYRYLRPGIYCAPLQLIRNTKSFAFPTEDEHTWREHHDLVHYAEFDRNLSNFLSM